MKIEEARQRIESAMTQYGAHAGVAIDLVISEVKSDLGVVHGQRIDRRVRPRITIQHRSDRTGILKQLSHGHTA